jgi:hypothetical protein
MKTLTTLAARINKAHEAGEATCWKGLEHFRQAGELLTEAKASLKHGQWLKWLKANVRFSQQQAWRYMQLAKLPVTSNLEDAWRVLCGNEPTTAERLVQSGENEWYTPAKYIEAARLVLGGIDLDPASSSRANKTVKATVFHSAEEDGLKRPWQGRLWLNPPYGRLAGEFVRRLIVEYQASAIESAIALVNAHCTDTDWFQPLWDCPLCFTDHRIDFDSNGRDKDATSTHGSVFAYFGKAEKEFKQEFAGFGAIVRKL